MTSSVFVRHTMKTLHSDLRVEMRRLAVHTPSRRERSLFVGLTVYGTTRVSGGLGEWQMWVRRSSHATTLTAAEIRRTGSRP
jgi:hypothetical protein